jgi:uncharacterized membrane protein HdeD (DUF308 family)
MPNLGPWIVVVVGLVILVFSAVSGQRFGFGSMAAIGILIGVAAVVAGLRWRRRSGSASHA